MFQKHMISLKSARFCFRSTRLLLEVQGLVWETHNLYEKHKSFLPKYELVLRQYEFFVPGYEFVLPGCRLFLPRYNLSLHTYKVFLPTDTQLLSRNKVPKNSCPIIYQFERLRPPFCIAFHVRFKLAGPKNQACVWKTRQVRSRDRRVRPSQA